MYESGLCNFNTYKDFCVERIENYIFNKFNGYKILDYNELFNNKIINKYQ